MTSTQELPVSKELTMNIWTLLYWSLFFQVQLNEKYGNFGCPVYIEVEDYQVLLSECDTESQQFLEKWYLLDDTVVPSVVRLRDLSSVISKYDDKKQYQSGAEEWFQHRERISNIMIALSTKIPSLRKYIKSG